MPDPILNDNGYTPSVPVIEDRPLPTMPETSNPFEQFNAPGTGMVTQRPVQRMIGGDTASLSSMAEQLKAKIATDPYHQAQRFETQQIENYETAENTPYFEQLGIRPGMDVEEVYGQAQTNWNKLGRAFGGAMSLAAHQFKDQLMSWGDTADLFTSDNVFKEAELEELNQWQKQFDQDWHIFQTQEDRNTFFNMSNFANMIQQSGYAIGAALEIAAEEYLMSMLTTATFGATSELQAARTAQLLGRLGKVAERTRNLEKTIQGTNTLRKIFNSGIGKLVNPVGDLTEFAMDFNKLRRADQLAYGATAGLRTAARGFGAFYRDMRMINAGITEAKAEAAGIMQDTYESLVADYSSQYGEPSPEKNDELKRRAYEAAQKGGAVQAMWIALSDRIAFDGMLKNFKAVRFLDDDLATRGIFRNTKEAIKEGGEEFVAKDGFKAFTHQLKTSPFKTLLKTPLNYTRNNLMEGVQEIGQDMINETTKNWYTYKYGTEAQRQELKTVTDIAYQSAEDQLTMDGMKTFMSGFLTGGIINVMGRGVRAGKGVVDRVKNREGYADTKKRAKEDRATMVNSLNTLVKDKGNFYRSLVEMNAEMDKAAKNGDKKAYWDYKTEFLNKYTMDLVKSGMHNVVIDRLQEATNELKPDEFKAAWKGAFPDGMTEDQAKRKMSGYLNEFRGKVEEVKETYESVRDGWGNPYNPARYKKGTPEYDKEVANYLAHQEAIEQIAFSKQLYTDIAKRQKGVLNELSKTLPNMGLNNLYTITSPYSSLNKELDLLEQEIKAIQDPKMKKQKEKRFKLLSDYQESLSDLFEALDKAGDNRDKQLKARNRFLKKHGKKLMALLNENQEQPLSIDDFNKAASSILDYMELQNDHDEALSYFNTVANPFNFDGLHQAHYQALLQMQQQAQQPAAQQSATNTATTATTTTTSAPAALTPEQQAALDKAIEALNKKRQDELDEAKYWAEYANENGTSDKDAKDILAKQTKEINEKYDKLIEEARKRVAQSAPSTTSTTGSSTNNTSKLDALKGKKIVFNDVTYTVTDVVDFEGMTMVIIKSDKGEEITDTLEDFTDKLKNGTYRQPGTKKPDENKNEPVDELEAFLQAEYEKVKKAAANWGNTVPDYEAWKKTSGKFATERFNKMKAEQSGNVTPAFKVGDKVTYQDKPYTVKDVTNTSDGRIVYHIEDADGKPLLEGGVRKYVEGSNLKARVENGEQKDSLAKRLFKELMDGKKLEEFTPEERDILNEPEYVEVRQKIDEALKARQGQVKPDFEKVKKLFELLHNGNKTITEFTPEEQAILNNPLYAGIEQERRDAIKKHQAAWAEAKGKIDLQEGFDKINALYDEQLKKALNGEVIVPIDLDPEDTSKNIKDYDQTHSDKRGQMEKDNERANLQYQEGLKQKAPADSLSNTTDLVKEERAGSTVRYVRNGENKNYVLDVATRDFMPGYSITYKVRTDFEPVVNRLTGETYDRKKIFNTDGTIKDGMADFVPIGVYAVIRGKEMLIGHLHEPQWIEYKIGTSYPHIVVPESELDQEYPQTVKKEVEKLRKLRKLMLENHNKNGNFVLHGVVNDKSIGVIRTVEEVGLLKDRVNPVIAEGGLENRHGMFAIVRQGTIQVDRNVEAPSLEQTDSFSPENISRYEGVPVLVLPTPKGSFFPSFIKLPNVDAGQAEFIIEAWKAFTGQTNNMELVTAVYDALKMYMSNGKPEIGVLKKYIDQYITVLNDEKLSKIGSKEGVDVKPGAARLNITKNGELYLQVKDGDTFHNLAAIKNASQLPANVKDLLQKLLTTVKFPDKDNSNIVGINSTRKAKFLTMKDGKLSAREMTYNQYIMEKAGTFVDKGMESQTSDKDWVYFANPVVKMDYTEPAPLPDVTSEQQKKPTSLEEINNTPRGNKAGSLLAALKARNLTEQQVKDQQTICKG